MTTMEGRTLEDELRSRLAAAVTERARATREAERLEARATLPGADERVAAAAETQRRLATEAAADVERLRAELRTVEGAIAAEEAAADEAAAADRRRDPAADAGPADDEG